jgi:hypothetical protein
VLRVVGWILNEYTLTLIGDLPVAFLTPYLKVIVALVIPEVMALNLIPGTFGLSIGDCFPCVRVTCCARQEAVAARGSIVTGVAKGYSIGKCNCSGRVVKHNADTTIVSGS